MKIRAFLYLAVVAAMLLPCAAQAQGSDEPAAQREHPARRLWAELNLTPEQETKFREINAKHAPARRDHARRMEELRTRINQELLKDRPSRSLLAQYAGQMGELQRRQNIASVDHMLDVKAVLTPEQFQIFTDHTSIGGVGGTGSGNRRSNRQQGERTAE